MPLIISTGMCDFKEIHEIIKILKNNFKKYSLLHCVSTYPTDLKNLNLKKIIYLKNKYKCDIGFSDHSNSEVAYLLAFLYGAKIYERHFKSDNKKFNRSVVDASFSSDAATFSKIVSNINELKILNKLKLTEISKCETKSRIQFRQSFHTKKLIYKGEKIKFNNLVLSRPGNGILPNQKKLIINKYLNKNLFKNKKISLKDLK